MKKHISILTTCLLFVFSICLAGGSVTLADVKQRMAQLTQDIAAWSSRCAQVKSNTPEATACLAEKQRLDARSAQLNAEYRRLGGQ